MKHTFTLKEPQISLSLNIGLMLLYQVTILLNSLNGSACLEENM